jgi:hypothetical protein
MLRSTLSQLLVSVAIRLTMSMLFMKKVRTSSSEIVIDSNATQRYLPYDVPQEK